MLSFLICKMALMILTFMGTLSYYYFLNLFIYFWLHWVFVAVHGLSLVGGEWGLLFIVVCRLLIAVASLVVEHRL